MSMAQEEPECPLCMETFDMDDLSFYPCTCGYQICRFCWHRIRNDENGLCPACRKPYPEDPAQFRPLTEDEVHNIKRDRRQKESQRKQKSAENRKHLANVRVVQKNLVFVVGLSQRLADPDVLKRHEYFGKFGKIHKVVINQSTSYVGSQGPSASAYVTYLRPEDALHAILVVNNLQIDNRTLKASLGTTKYCSNFLKGTQCTKSDCMYLHDLGDEAASFSKEDIQQGKHLQYEQKLIDQYSQSSQETGRLTNGKSKSPSPSTGDHTTSAPPPPVEVSNPPTQPPVSQKPSNVAAETSGTNFGTSNGQLDKIDGLFECEKAIPDKVKVNDLSNNNSSGDEHQASMKERNVGKGKKNDSLHEESNDSDVPDDDFGFDPWELSSKGLADMIEKERQVLQKISLTNHMSQLAGQQTKSSLQNNQSQSNHNHHNSIPFNVFQSQHSNWPTKPFPPPFIDSARQNSKLLQMMSSRTPSDEHHYQNSRVGEGFNGQAWQDNLKALLPNISFSAPSSVNSQQQGLRRTSHPLLNNSPIHHHHNTHNGFHPFNNQLQFQDHEWFSNGGPTCYSSLQNVVTSDPAVISSGVISEGNPLWMEPITEMGDSLCHHSLHHHQLHRHHHHLGYGLHPDPQPSWMQQHTRYPPPGFSTRQQEAPTEQRLPAL